MSGRIQNKVAVVTGAGDGMGAAIAERFVREGAYVVAVDVSGRQDEVAERLGECCVRYQADLALFLASDEARFITGTEILIDGGYTAL